jgi:hypothetical protein
MSHPTTRRNFLRLVGGAGMMLAANDAATFARRSGALATAKTYMEPFDYRGVTLLDGMLKRQYQATRDFFLKLPEDDILKGFRERAGLPAPGKNLGGWYGGEPTLQEFPGLWWAGGDTYNTFGQWLSGMARMHAATHDEEILDKACRLMREWAKTIEPDGYFYYSRNPRTFHYTYEKTLCGLVDLYVYGHQPEALSLLERITDWAVKNLDRTRKTPSPEDFTAGGQEWYTLCENLYRAYQATGNPKYKEFGDLWRYTPYWSKFLAPTDPDIHGLHAYSHVNTLSSAAMTYAVTGEPDYLKAIINAYDSFDRTQFYATGGYGASERLVTPDGSLGKSLETEANTFETVCGSWAGFKLGRYLIQFTGEAKYGDWMERLLYNGIGAALPMSPDGRTFYYSDYRLGGGQKIYHTEWRWPCCAGTYPQAVADYHNIIYFKNDTGLYVNLFVPSEVTWKHHGEEIRVIQETTYPESEATLLTVNPQHSTAFALGFRVPAWTRGVTVAVNGVQVDADCVPGQWATLRRTWNPGDKVAIRLPMRIELVPIDKQHPHRVAFRYGPIVLVRIQESFAVPAGTETAKRFFAGPHPLEFQLQVPTSGRFVPFYRVGYMTPYHMYFEMRP